MPDIISIIARRGKLIIALTTIAALIALVISLLRPKEYLSVATALPANSLTADKARIFNSNVEALYPEIGTVDELDRIEGTARLDTVFIAVADSFGLTSHYGIKQGGDAGYKAALALKKNSDIQRSAYGELKIQVWDGDAAVAAQLANALMQKLNEIHQHIQNVNNAQILQQLRQGLLAKQRIIDSVATIQPSFAINDTLSRQAKQVSSTLPKLTILQEQVTEYQQIISEYELAISTNPNVLIPVEYARSSPWPDKPKTLQTTLFAFGASLIFSFLLALLVESRSQKI